ncbi:allantoinase AllB [Flaviaesturariibacter amylovorans]|uniref:allantoinase n=1 Tax=Flaviaesturariibacter amylovorans TaxID=1084520 RepID=A0ABP8GZ30_9BACT
MMRKDRNSVYSKKVWIDGGFHEATVFMRNGIITHIEPGPFPAERMPHTKPIDARFHMVIPGLIDVHVHVNEPGRTHWEGFETATKAALQSGITTIVDMPLNASPVTTSVAALEAKKEASRDKMYTNVGFYGGLVPGNLHEIGPLIEAGVLGIKAFLTHSGIDDFPNVTEADLEAAAPLLAQHNVPLLLHCELDEPGTREALKHSPRSYAAYLASRPKDWEDRAVAMAIDVCRRFCCPVHIVHVSSASALPLIAAAKAEGLPLTAETCPHYLLFNAENIADGNTLYKCAPPIRERANNELLKAALRDGILDLIASDHSPAPPELKMLDSGNLLEAWGGIAGLQYLLPASWTALADVLTPEQFIPLLTEAPARLLRLDNRKGFIRVGYDADLTLWSPGSADWKIRPVSGAVLHRHKTTPYLEHGLQDVGGDSFLAGIPITAGFHNLPKTPNGTWLFRK